MKSVLIIGMTPNPGGIESFLMTYFRKLKDTFKIDFLTTFETCAYSQEILDNNSRIYTIKSSQFKQAKEFKQELTYFFQHHHYDIIWFNACDLGNFGLLKYAQLCSPEKVIVHAHNNDFMMKGKKALFYKFMHYKNKKKVKQYATDYWACSELAGEFFFEDDVRQSSRYHVINNAIDTDRFKYDREVRAAYRKDLHAEDKIVVMNEGLIQQIGSPIDIYNEPENRFVANFIGESNIVEGHFIKDYLVEWHGQQFECVDKGFEEGQEVDIVLRPEDLDIVEPGRGKIAGEVVSVIFKGVHYEILVRTENQDYKIHTTDLTEVGKKVDLDFWPEDIHVMEPMGTY